MIVDRRRTRASAVLLACCALLPLPIRAQSEGFTTQVQMGISKPYYQTQQTYFVPDGQCSAQIEPSQMCWGSRPLAVRVEVADAAPYPVVQVLETLQTARVFRAAGERGTCAGLAAVRLLLHCP